LFKGQLRLFIIISLRLFTNTNQLRGMYMQNSESLIPQEMFGDTKVVIRSRKFKEQTIQWPKGKGRK